jgi:peptide methionine sulfoxide reductase MsrB
MNERLDAREGGTEVRSAHGDSHLGHKDGHFAA